MALRVGRRIRSASMKYITPGYWDANSHVSSKLRNVSGVSAHISLIRPSLRPASGCRAPFWRPDAKRQKILKDVKAAVKTWPEDCRKSDKGGDGCPWARRPSFGKSGGNGNCRRCAGRLRTKGSYGRADRASVPILRKISENDQPKYLFASVLP